MNSIIEIWDRVLELLASKLTPTAINTWFADCTPVAIEDCTLVIHTPTEFKRTLIEKRYAHYINEIMSDIFSCDFDLIVLTGDERLEEKTSDNSVLPGTDMESYTFDRFIVGNSNKFAHAAAMSVAENPGNKQLNPLMIYGNSGLGKTHLLMAIANVIHTNFPEKKMAYLKGDDFTNQLVNSLRNSSMDEFREKYRNVDLLLVDDIQFIAGKERTQEEFFHTFNNIYEAGHQIVITSDRPPNEMTLLDDRLRTRFEGGLMADIQPPDLETRMAITKNKASQFGLILSDESVDCIAKSLTANVRQIEGVIKKITAYKEILNDVIDIEAVKRAIADVGKNGTYIPTPDRIIHETSRYYGVTDEEIKGQNRSRNTSIARQVSMYLMRTHTQLSLDDIGAEYEDRNHSTVLASIRKIEDLIKTDPKMQATIRDITSNINSI